MTHAVTAEIYALGLLAEESGEVCQLVGKALRFGLDTPHRPDNPKAHDARGMLELEVGDILAAIRYAIAAGLIRKDAIEAQANAKFAKLANPESRDNLRRRLAPEVSEPVVIDLDVEFWKSIQKAAEESTWIPPEYFVNDWVSDVCRYLREGHPA